MKFYYSGPRAHRNQQKKPDDRTPEQIAANRARVEAWYAVWDALTPEQQAAWHALTPAEQQATKQLDAEAFRARMTEQAN